MGALLVLLGIMVAVIAAPVLLFQEYRRQLAAGRADAAGGLPPARVEGMHASLVRSGEAARSHRLALQAAVYRRLVPAWAIGLALMLLGVLLA